MTGLGDLWFLVEEATQQAERAAHRLETRYEASLSWDRTRNVSRGRFRTLAERIRQSGTPFGAHTIVYRANGDLLLCRHEAVDLWVLPGGEVGREESYHEAARRELAEEAGVTVSYDGLAIANRITIRHGEYETWGVLPVFAAEAETEQPNVTDPDGEITDVRWFDELPADTRDRADLVAWREQAFG